MQRTLPGFKTILIILFIVFTSEFLAAVPAVAQTGDAPWPMAGANSFKNRRVAVNGPGGGAALQTWWQFQAPAGAFSGDPVVGEDGTVYVGTTAGAVYALDRDDGRVKWSVSLGRPVIGSPAVDAGSGAVYVAYGGSGGGEDFYAICSLDAGNGNSRWSLRSPPLYGGDDTPITASPTVGGDGIYVPVENGVWKVTSDGRTVWYFKGLGYGHKNYCSPAVANGKVMFATSGGRAYVLSASDAALQWVTALAGSFDPNIADEITTAVSTDGNVMYCSFKSVAKVYAVYTIWSGLKWSILGSAPFRPAAVGADGTVYVSGANGELFALDPADGSLRWSIDLGENAATDGSPAVGGDGAVYLLRGLSLCAIDSGSGELRWEYPLAAEGNGVGSPVLAGNGTVLVRTESSSSGAFLFAVGPDVTPPAVTACDPPGGAGEVQINANLVLTFSEDVAAREGKGIIIKKREDDALAVEIPAAGDRVAINGNIVTIDPVNDLDYGTRYYVLIDPGAFRDLAGNDYAGIGDKNVWSFTTVSPPEVSSTVPADGAEGVPLDTAITVIFSEEVRSGGASGGMKVYKTNEPESVVAFTYRISGANLVIELVGDGPEGGLEPGVAYTVYLPAGAVEDLAGCPLAQNYVFSFTTALADESDTTPPTPPGDLSAGPVSSTAIDLAWVAATDNVGVAGYSVEMRRGEEGSYAVIGTTTETAFRATGLVPGTTYTFRVQAYDAAGNYSGYSNAAGATTMEDQPEENPLPQVVGRAPAGSGAAVNGSLRATFDLAVQAVDPRGVPFVLACADGAGITVYGQVDGSALTVTAPYSSLAYNTAYTVTIPAGSVVSVIYATYNDEESWSFTTVMEPDATPPQVISTVPANGQTNVPVNPVITVTFSEPVTSGDKYGQIVLRTGNHDVPIAKRIDGCSLVITPQGPLAGGSFYTVVIPAGAVEDAAGNHLAEECPFVFATRPDSPDGGEGDDYILLRIEVPVRPDSATIAELSGKVRVEAPAGAITGENAVLVVEVVDANRAAAAGMPLCGPVVNIAVRDGAVAGKIGVLIFINKSGSGGGREPAAFFYDNEGGRWLKLGGVVDRNRGTVAFAIDHLTLFAVFEAAKVTPRPAVAFLDMAGHWAEETVNRLAEMGLVAGYPDGTFRPEKPVTRAEAAALLVRAIKAPPATGKDLQVLSRKMADAADIPSWAQGAAAAAVREGLIKGLPHGDALFFAAGHPVTRVELAVILARALKQKEDRPAPGQLRFADAGSIPRWAAEDLAAAAGAGLIRGYPDGTFRPADPVTRAEAAAVVKRFLD
ncbi:MAG: Ig-like domain-containing protein [Bacillota bacterium]